MSRVKNVKQVTHNRFLNFFELEAEDRKGHAFPYYMASRSDRVSDLRMNRPDRTPDGVAIFALYGEKADRIVLVRQYRYAIGTYIYELPAGLVEEGEDLITAAEREMREETGLRFEAIPADPVFEKGYYTTVGMTDECCSMVYGRAFGEVSLDRLEESEQLEVVLADRQEAARILREEKVALMCAYRLMHFIANEDPLAGFAAL